MTPRTDLSPHMLPVATTNRQARLGPPRAMTAPGMVRQQDLLLAAPAVLAILAGVLVRAV